MKMLWGGRRGVTFGRRKWSARARDQSAKIGINEAPEKCGQKLALPPSRHLPNAPLVSVRENTSLRPDDGNGDVVLPARYSNLPPALTQRNRCGVPAERGPLPGENLGSTIRVATKPHYTIFPQALSSFTDGV